MMKKILLIVVVIIFTFSCIVISAGDNAGFKQKSDLMFTSGVIININAKNNTITVKDKANKTTTFKVKKRMIDRIKINNSKVRIIYKKSKNDFVVLRIKESGKKALNLD